MTGRFTASNGWYVEKDVLYTPDNGSFADICASPSKKALLEYGRHLERTQRDAELGRERIEGHPDVVIYPRGLLAPGIRIVDERVGGKDSFYAERPSEDNEGHLSFATREARAIARAWFDSQPKPKPWADAEDGQIWELDGVQYIAINRRFFRLPFRRPIESGWEAGSFASDFTEGELIWSPRGES